MRKTLIVTLCAVMAVSMVACGSNTSEEAVDEVVTASESTADTKPEENVKIDSKSTSKTSDKGTTAKKDNNKTSETTDKKDDKSQDAEKTDEKKSATTAKKGEKKTGTTVKTMTTKEDKTTDNDSATLDKSKEQATTQEPYYDRAMAESIWAMVNAERTANGLPALEWDEAAYNYACGRCVYITSDFSHTGCTMNGENILMNGNSSATASTLHNQWYNSPGHHANYLSADYYSGACAVYYYQGSYYAVENFTTYFWSEDGHQFKTQEEYREYQLAKDGVSIVDHWQASNGVMIEVDSNGTLTLYPADGQPYVDDESMHAAVDEYNAAHGL